MPIEIDNYVRFEIPHFGHHLSGVALLGDAALSDAFRLLESRGAYHAPRRLKILRREQFLSERRYKTEQLSIIVAPGRFMASPFRSLFIYDLPYGFVSAVKPLVAAVDETREIACALVPDHPSKHRPLMLGMSKKVFEVLYEPA